MCIRTNMDLVLGKNIGRLKCQPIKLRELAVNMISRINSTPINELPDQSLHTEMINLQQDINEHLSEKSIYHQIEEFKSTMKSTQGITVSTTHRNAIIQAEIETKDEYLRLNQGSSESVLDTTSKDRGTSSGLIERDVVSKVPDKITDHPQNIENNFIDSTRINQNSDFKMKSKFEGMKGFVAPKSKKEKRVPDENSNLEHVKNSISVNLMKESINNSGDEEELSYDDDEIDDDDETKIRRSEKNRRNSHDGVDKVDNKDVINKARTEISEADELLRKQQHLERLEKIASMKAKEYLIGWG